MKRKGQAFFYGLLGLLFGIIFFSAAAPIIQNSISSVASTQTTTTQAMLGIVLPGVAIALIVGFWKTISPSST